MPAGAAGARRGVFPAGKRRKGATFSAGAVTKGVVRRVPRIGAAQSAQRNRTRRIDSARAAGGASRGGGFAAAC